MMAFARSWRHNRLVDGPYQAGPDDIPELNEVFTDAFTQRYRKDGMVGVRVPYLNPTIWRFAIADAAEGAMLWRGDRNEVVAFNIVHRSGVEGWMGPLAVHPDYQGHGVGKSIVNAGIEWLKRAGARVIGLETMPRTIDNIGFYSSLDLVPGPLTITVTLDAERATIPGVQLSRIVPDARDEMIAACRTLVECIQPGYDFTRELALTDSLSIGDTILLLRDNALHGFALCHTAPLVEGRVREEIRVLKLVARTEQDFDDLITLLADYARRSGTRRIAVRLQGEYPELYRRLIARRARVRWTDLRMSVHGYQEHRPDAGVVLSNWEI